MAQSAQNAKGVTVSQWELLSSHVLKIDSQIVWCCCSMMLFTWELYAIMQMWWIPYLSVSQSSAVIYDVLLSVMISLTTPHLYRISLKMKLPSMQPVSTQRAHYSGHAVSKHWACMMYLKPPVGGINIVSMYTLWNSGAGVSTVGGSQILVVCWIWHQWHVWTYHLILLSSASHQKMIE